MIAAAGTLSLSFVAGLLSTLSPCVLPLLPIVIGSAASHHRRGPLALALGLGLSFTLAGIVLSSLGLYLGFNQGWLRNVAAVVLVLFGVVLLSAGLQRRFASATGALATAGDALSQRIRLDGVAGQFALGLVLGLVWAPCVGPTLGAAVTLASQGQALGEVAPIMLVFGIGAALPLAAFGMLSREALLRLRVKMQGFGAAGKYVLGVLLIGVGTAILAGADKPLEARLVEWSPAWLTELTTRF
ncbi:MAG: cytochrome c biogenesis CcdA family protein [Casimicrobiaceae bacterium]